MARPSQYPQLNFLSGAICGGHSGNGCCGWFSTSVRTTLKPLETMGNVGNYREIESETGVSERWCERISAVGRVNKYLNSWGASGWPFWMFCPLPTSFSRDLGCFVEGHRLRNQGATCLKGPFTMVDVLLASLESHKKWIPFKRHTSTEGCEKKKSRPCWTLLLACSYMGRLSCPACLV